MIKELAQYIEDEDIGFDIGSNLFAGHRSEGDPEECVVLIETPGGNALFYVPDFESKVIQVISRSKSYQTARANSYAIYDLLHGRAGIEFPVVDEGDEYWINTIEATSPPASLGQDERGLYEFVTNFILNIQDN